MGLGEAGVEKAPLVFAVLKSLAMDLLDTTIRTVVEMIRAQPS